MFERNEDYFEPQYAATSLQKHAVRTFGWMTLGLLVTTATAFAVYSTDLIYYIYTMRFAPLILIAAQFGVVIALGARLMKMSATSAKILCFFIKCLQNSIRNRLRHCILLLL